MGFDRALFKRLMAELPRKNLERLARERPDYAIITISVKVSAREKLGLWDLIAEEEGMTMSRYMRNLLRERLGLGAKVYPDYDTEEEYQEALSAL